MSQITVYLDRDTESKMRLAAKAAGRSISQWIVGLIREKTQAEWPPNIHQLVGAWAQGADAAREIRPKAP